jgi:hypothetical protein
MKTEINILQAFVLILILVIITNAIEKILGWHEPWWISLISGILFIRLFPLKRRRKKT